MNEEKKFDVAITSMKVVDSYDPGGESSVFEFYSEDTCVYSLKIWSSCCYRTKQFDGKIPQEEQE